MYLVFSYDTVMKQMKVTYAVCVVLCIIAVFIVVFIVKHVVYRNTVLVTQADTQASRNAVPPHLGHAASSVDSENQFAGPEKWHGQASKCYDCEKDMASRCGNVSVFTATKQKCFDC